MEHVIVHFFKFCLVFHIFYITAALLFLSSIVPHLSFLPGHKTVRVQDLWCSGGPGSRVVCSGLHGLGVPEEVGQLCFR